VVSFGTGRGIRDRLGLLRIAVNPEKEIIETVVGQGLGDACLALAMEAGASGATITSGTRMGARAAQDAAGRWVSREVEILDLSAEPDTAAGIVDALRGIPEFGEPGAAPRTSSPSRCPGP
jgi:hypothetical protein